jgi:hypothetical protein
VISTGTTVGQSVAPASEPPHWSLVHDHAAAGQSAPVGPAAVPAQQWLVVEHHPQVPTDVHDAQSVAGAQFFSGAPPSNPGHIG